MVPKICSIPECDSEAVSRGWCTPHYTRWRRHGNPLAGGIMRPKVSVEKRFFSKVDKTDSCWIWLGSRNDQGYGIFHVDRKQIRAHRFSWSIAFGNLLSDQQLDHRCRQKYCVNPSHLRIVTNKQNGENVGLSSRNKSGYKGVQFEKRAGKWVVTVVHNRVRHHGGYFDDVHEAGVAAVDLRNRLFTHNDIDRTNK